MDASTTNKLKQLLTSPDEDNIRLGFHLITQQGYNETLKKTMTATSTKQSFCLEYGFGWLLLDKLPVSHLTAQLLKANKGKILPGWKKGYEMLKELYSKRKELTLQLDNQQKNLLRIQKIQQEVVAYQSRKDAARQAGISFTEKEPDMDTFDHLYYETTHEYSALKDDLQAVDEHIEIIETKLRETLSVEG